MEKNDGYRWIKVSETIEEIPFRANGLVEMKVAGKAVCIGFHNGAIFACAARCPHAGGIIAEGYWDAAGNIVCPLHRYKFNPKNGRNVSGEGYYLKIFPIDIRKDGVFVAFTENNLLNWLK